MRIFAICLMIFLFSSCDRAAMLDKKDWKWVKTISKDGQVIEPISQDAFVISLDFESNKFTAKTDCNRFFGTFSVNGKNLTFANIGSTRMFCKASQERIFIDQLASSNSYVLDSLPETIILISKNGGKLFLKSL